MDIEIIIILLQVVLRFFSYVFPSSATGRYLYIEATDNPVGTTFELFTPPLNTDSPGPYQVTFWLHRNGEHMGSLVVEEMVGETAGAQLWESPAGAYTGTTLLLWLPLKP